jgi:hypothetical protein
MRGEDYSFISHYGTIRISELTKTRVIFIPSLNIGVHVKNKVNRVLVRIIDDIRWEHIDADDPTIDLNALSNLERLRVTERVLEEL